MYGVSAGLFVDCDGMSTVLARSLVGWLEVPTNSAHVNEATTQIQKIDGHPINGLERQGSSMVELTLDGEPSPHESCWEERCQYTDVGVFRDVRVRSWKCS